MLDYIQDNLQWLITVIVAPIIAFITGRDFRKNKYEKSKEELKSSSISNLEANLNIYQEMVDDLKTRFQSRIEELEEDLDRLKILNEESRKVISRQDKFIKKQRLYIDKLEGLLTANNINFDNNEIR